MSVDSGQVSVKTLGLALRLYAKREDSMIVEVGGSETAMWPLALGVLLVVLVIV
ncbi:MAG: hypothetical protein H7175_26665 [Burkholderiales bacterium]|nr:hypothetical protein [Anaerolineae bacterium]